MVLYIKNLNLAMLFSLIVYTIMCTISLLCCLPFSIAANNETDRVALLELKAKISHDPLGVTSSWNDTLHFCKWYGVTCSHRHQRVTRLDLESSKLTGTLSPYLGNLSFLKELYLENNSFSGVIPLQIDRLHRLQTLYLDNNSFIGEIPSNISSCYSLRDLTFANNRLEGGIPPTLGSLPHLQYLFLAKNNLKGNIPSSLGNLSSLSVLHILDNNLVGRIPDSLGKLRNLNALSLQVNHLYGVVPPSIFNLSLLTRLALDDNDLEGNLPSDVGNTLPHLQLFFVSRNRFTGHIPASISNSSNLQRLQLSSNNLQGQVPSLHKLSRLVELELSANSLGYGQAGDLNFVSSLSNATNLQWFEIAENNFTGLFPNIICNCSSLTALILYSNNLAGHIPTCIENLARLRLFDPSFNLFSGIIPQSIGKLHNLNILLIEGNQLSGVIPPSIGNLTMLSSFSLFNNHLEGQIPSTLGNCKFLTALSLASNNLSGNIPSQLFSGLTFLSDFLELGGNRLTGSLPEEVGQLKNLNGLEVSHNMLSGQIPSSLGSCVSLQYLFMRGNHFQGTIPDVLQTLKGLLKLDLSNNNLSGEIPNFLSTLQLQALNLSSNNLEGRVPIGGVFNNATAAVVSGNTRLCGGIPQLKLPLCNFSSNSQKRRSKHWKKLLVAIFSGFIGVTLLLAFLVLLYIFRQRKKTQKPTASDDSENYFPTLSYQTLLKATNGFSSENLIGSGTFGVVYKGILDEDGSNIAIKTFKLEYRGASKSFLAECGVLRNIRHRNLVKVITVCSSVDHQGRDFKAVIYEYMLNGSLEDWLHPNNTTSSRSLNLRQRLDIAVDVAFALEYLHHHCGTSIVHCDLKPSNVLLDGEMVAHVGDFGLAKFLLKGINDSQANQSSSIGVRGTIGYAPPEYGMGNELSTSGDVYSFGILLMEMFTGKRPTDDMFKGGLSLHGFVKEALPEHVIKILDHVLLGDIYSEETNSSLMLEALNSILGIALSCSNDAQSERLDMNDVVAKLSSNRNKLLATRQE